MQINPWYITGFVDGEGSFLVSFSVRPKMRIGIEVRPSFAVAQNQRSKETIYLLKTFFDCGSVRFNTSDKTYKYEVRSLNDLINIIIPHFEQYPLHTSKQNDFERLRAICLLMKSRGHHTHDGIKRVIESAYQMNGIGARRYAKQDLLRIVQR